MVLLTVFLSASVGLAGALEAPLGGDLGFGSAARGWGFAAAISIGLLLACWRAWVMVRLNCRSWI